ncbi:3,4-dihydroxy-2-butanone-4-phosphate synthase [Nitrosopumilus sp.]|jgi:3,4-dihydroxy 2-butanone 4-phosphate synthase|nr:3,4-dihydroxy-2-butanone-4-phosphate synthase [Nitrosopumilus sp.]
MSLETGLESLKRGEFVLLFDSAGRENEIDMVVAAEFITPEHVARMRQNAGGLLCIALENNFAKSLELQYMHDILASSSMSNKEMIMGLAPYGDYPTFTLSVNHYQTYTGITDKDRALTILEMANIFKVENKQKKFSSSFKTPGHVPLLIASEGLVASRQGHTEMSVYLAKTAGLTPVTAICEMMDAETYTALSVDKAEKFGKQNGIPLIDGKELLEYAKVN